MNIGILSQLRQNKITGINRVTVGLMSELLKIDKDNTYTFLGRTDWLPVDIGHVGMLFDSSKTMELDFALFSHNIDIVHSHYRPFTFSDKCSVARILTIHDLIPLLYPEWNNNQYEYFDGPIRRCAEEADVVIAVSECTKNDIIQAYKLPEDKVRVIYNGLYTSGAFSKTVAKLFAPLAGVEYLLTVSAVGANKNQSGLVKAFSAFKQRHNNCTTKLAICGPVRQYSEIHEIESEWRGVDQDIFFTGFVSDDELSWLYNNAKAFIYPSYYEGFGLPILEALASGCAVISSNTSSMPEVGGDACEYCDPYDVESIVQAMENVLLNDDRRQELKRMAKVQASKYTYERAARETLEIYKLFE